jgi:hypothetical protein
MLNHRVKYMLLVGKQEEKRSLGRPRILNWILGRGYSGIDSGSEPVEGSCECCNEPSISIKCWEVLEVSSQLPASRVVLSSPEFVRIGRNFAYSLRRVKTSAILGCIRDDDADGTGHYMYAQFVL